MTVVQDWSDGPYLPEVAGAWPPLAHCLNQNPPGWALEFGVGAGNSTRMIAARMPVVGFDCFTGLPEDWETYPAGTFACAPPTIPNTRLVIGLFADTLPGFDFRTVDPVGLVHIDCDLYSSTATVLQWVMPHLRAGCYLVFDEWFGHPEHEPRAFREYTESHPEVSWRVVGRSDQPWAIQLT